MEKAIPAKFQNPSFDPFSEVLDLLCDPQTLPVQHQRLQQLVSSMEAIAGQSVEENQGEVNDYLMNLRESEEILIDYLAYTQEIRGELKDSKRILQEKQRDIKLIWLNGIYNGTIVKGLEDIEEILDSLNSIDLLIKEKLYMKAANTIKESVQIIDSADYSYLPVSQRIKEAFAKKLKKLSEQIMEELKCFLLLKHSSFEVELRKFSVVGILNIPYLLSEEEEKEQIDSMSIAGLIDTLAVIEQLNRIEHLNMWDIQTDIQDLYKKCFAQFPTILVEEERMRDFTIASIVVDTFSRETALKVMNSVVAVAALVIRNHFLLKQSLNKYMYTFTMGWIWEKIQKEIIDVFRTIVKIPEPMRESLAESMLMVEEKDSTYTSLLSSILDLSPYHYPYLYKHIDSYLSQFHSAIQEGSLVSWVDDCNLQFLETLKLDSCKMFSTCASSNDAFRLSRSGDLKFMCCQVLNSNLATLCEIRNLLPEKFAFYIVDISATMVAFFFRELNGIIDKHTKDSKFYSLILEDEEIFQEIRLEKLYDSVHLRIPVQVSSAFVKALGYLNEKKGKLEDTENIFLKFNAIGKSTFIGESAKLNFLAAVVENVESIYESLLLMIEDLIDMIFEEPEDFKHSSEIDREPKKRSAFRNFTNKIKEGLKKQRRLSHKFFIETRFSSDSIKVSDEEITTLLKNQLVHFHYIHDVCLFLLRGEIRMRIYSFLSNIKGQNYWDGEEHTDAEWFIGHLSRELILVQLAIKPVLKTSKIGFVWENAVDILVEMLITGLGEIKEKRMSKHGLATYVKNVKVLQAELVQIEIVKFN